MIGEHLNKYTFEYLISQALEMVPDDVDKREGSIIYDALAPACYELAKYYIRLQDMLRETFAITASGQYLDLRVQEHGIHRYPASKAVKKGHFKDSSGNPFAIPIGSRFATISETNSINYTVTGQFIFEGGAVAGVYELECEETGTQGNNYIGNIIPLTYINGLSYAYMDDIIIPARDDEKDEVLRQRYFDSLKFKPFGGNIIQYREMLLEIAGVGAVQIYPVWDGGGTVKCVVVDSSYNKVTPEFLEILQNMIDPNIDGVGIGRAPIGHKVTMATPNEVIINITADITLSQGFLIDQVEQPIIDAMEAYMLELRQKWGVGTDFNQYLISVFTSRIVSDMMTIPGIYNAKDIKINNSPFDLPMTQNSLVQEIPVLGEVILNVN